MVVAVPVAVTVHGKFHREGKRARKKQEVWCEIQKFSKDVSETTQKSYMENSSRHDQRWMELSAITSTTSGRSIDVDVDTPCNPSEERTLLLLKIFDSFLLEERFCLQGWR